MEFRQTIYKNYLVSKNGIVKNLNKHQNCKEYVTQRLDKDGYYRVCLRVNNKNKLVPVHRLVAFAFIDGHRLGLVVNHKNGIRTDNNFENLEWVTSADNERHARRVLGKKLFGEKASRSKLKTKQVIEIKFLLETSSLSFKQIAKTYGVSNSQIQRINNGKNWGHLWKEKPSISHAKGQTFANWMNSKFCKAI